MRNSSSQTGPLAFGDFLDYLRRQGFTIGVADVLRLQQLLNKMSGDCAPADLKTLLCPILATNKSQQEQFYAAFDAYFDLFQPAFFEKSSDRDEEALLTTATVSTDPFQSAGVRKWSGE